MSRDNRAFEIAHEAVTAEQAAKYYGLTVNNQHRANCPFHGGEHWNFSFKGSGYHCFVCGASGDAISFAQAYNHFEKPIDALRSLNDGFNLGLELDSGKPPRIDENALREARRRRAARELPERGRRILWDYYLALDWLQRKCAPKTPEDDYPELWVYALHHVDYAQYLVDCYDDMGDAERLSYITERKEMFRDYEKLTRVVERLRRNAA